MKIRIVYYALLRQERGAAEEVLDFKPQTARELFASLKALHTFSLAEKQVKVAINSKISSWETPIQADDTIVFMPPVAGG